MIKLTLIVLFGFFVQLVMGATSYSLTKNFEKVLIFYHAKILRSFLSHSRWSNHVILFSSIWFLL